MISALHHGWRLILLAAIASASAAGDASAQPPARESTAPRSLVAGARVSRGDLVYVTDTTGSTTRGKLAVLTDEALQVQLEDGVRSFRTTEIRRIQRHDPDSPLNGVLVGAAVGAIPGLYWLIVDPNECHGMCAEEYALIGVGAALGGLIDHLIKKKVTVYAAGEPSQGNPGLRLSALVGNGRKGVRVAVIF